MKKKIEKLQLHRETLRNLMERDLREVVGRATVHRTCEGWTQAYATCDCSFPPSFACC
jgi:hypothetical protein